MWRARLWGSNLSIAEVLCHAVQYLSCFFCSDSTKHFWFLENNLTAAPHHLWPSRNCMSYRKACRTSSRGLVKLGLKMFSEITLLPVALFEVAGMLETDFTNCRSKSWKHWYQNTPKYNCVETFCCKGSPSFSPYNLCASRLIPRASPNIREVCFVSLWESKQLPHLSPYPCSLVSGGWFSRSQVCPHLSHCIFSNKVARQGLTSIWMILNSASASFNKPLAWYPASSRCNIILWVQVAISHVVFYKHVVLCKYDQICEWKTCACKGP